MSQYLRNINSMILQIFTRQKHVADQIQQNYCTFGTILKFLLSQNVNH